MLHTDSSKMKALFVIKQSLFQEFSIRVIVLHQYSCHDKCCLYPAVELVIKVLFLCRKYRDMLYRRYRQGALHMLVLITSLAYDRHFIIGGKGEMI